MGPPPSNLHLHKVAGWTVGEAGFLGGQPREAAFQERNFVFASILTS